MKGEGAVNSGTKVVASRDGMEEVVLPVHVSGNATTGEEHCKQVFVPKYNSTVNNLTWATKGLVVSVLNGDAIPVLQRRVLKLVIIPLGANKVFLRTIDDRDVSVILSEAADFFNNLFSKPVRWNKDTLIRERGAWLRIYGVSLHV